MRTMASLVLAALVLLGSRAAALAETSMKVQWLTSMEAAKKQAAATGRPILMFHLLGRLDEEYC